MVTKNLIIDAHCYSYYRPRLAPLNPGNPYFNAQHNLMGDPRKIECLRTIRRTLERRISENGGKINFREFMQIALYSGSGYYSSGTVRIGSDFPDFNTYTETAPRIFGIGLGEKIHEMWKRLGSPRRFQVVEMGAGNGILAEAILSHLKSKPGLFEALDYIIVEISPSLIKRQKQKLENLGFPIRWVLGSATDPPLKNINGVFISNELPDAFPVHRVKMDEWGELRELHVTYQEGRLKEILGDLSSLAIREYIERLRGLHGKERVDDLLKDGLPVNLDMISWQRELSRSLNSGYVVTIDYGYVDLPARSARTLFRAHSGQYCHDYERMQAKLDFFYTDCRA